MAQKNNNLRNISCISRKIEESMLNLVMTKLGLGK